MKAVDIRQVRDLVKAKAHLIRLSQSDPLVDLLKPVLILCLKLIRNDYARRVGIPTYLSQMLLAESTALMADCSLLWSGGRKVRGVDGQEVQKYLAARCGSDLPDIVRIRLESGEEIERYL